MKKILLIPIFLFFWQEITLAQRGIDTTAFNMKTFADSIAGQEASNYRRAEKLLQWLSGNFDWLATDYKTRTVKEILARGGGNCYELSVVYMALIKEMGIRYRPVAEVNLHVETPRRQEDAAKLVLEKGNRVTIFGFNHNDHRWIEIYNEKTNDWIPADPSLGVIGLENWLKARAWFGERKSLNQELAKDMVVPIAIFIVGPGGKMLQNRTKHYVVDELDRLYGRKLMQTPEWASWVSGIEKISEQCRETFQGERNLHHSQSLIKDLGLVYHHMKKSLEKMQQRNIVKDTLRIGAGDVDTKRLIPGIHRYLVYFKMGVDSPRSRPQFWTREIRKETYQGTDAIIVVQDWEDRDTIVHKVRTVCDPVTFATRYQWSWWKQFGESVFDFTNKTASMRGLPLSDSDTARNRKGPWDAFKKATSQYCLNWHLDLEVFPLLAFKEGRTFLVPFYDPGSPAPTEQAYTVEGSAKLKGYDGAESDCWLLSHGSAGSREIFWISKKTREVLKLENEIGVNRWRYKIKLGFSE